jgi:hypothetical protein
MSFPELQATDQVPPTLPAIPPPRIQRGDGSSMQEGCGGECSSGGAGFIEIAAVATDDMSVPGVIGYRFTLEAGALPPGLRLPEVAIAPSRTIVRLVIAGDDGDDAFDFTLRVVAIDRAGNESAPQTVRVAHDPGGACAIARRRPSRGAAPWLALAAVLIAAHRSRRRPS